MTVRMTENSRLQFVADALRSYTEDFTIRSTNDPFLVRLSGVDFSVHVAPIHGASRTNDDEERIQVPTPLREEQAARSRRGIHPIFIGVFPKGDVFSAWEPDYVLSLEAADVGSIYARASHHEAVIAEDAALREFSSAKLGRRTRLVSLPMEQFGFYLENCDVVHRAREVRELVALLALADATLPVAPGSAPRSVDLDVGGQRERVTVTRTAYPRDPKFSRDVVEAYGYRCAVCGRQLGLVQAAHIIPHNQDDCPNDVTNGIALCVEHHRLYDDALLLPGPDGSLHLNENRVEHLENINQTEGLDAVRALAAKGYRLPDDRDRHPNSDYLNRGLKIRLGQGG